LFGLKNRAGWEKLEAGNATSKKRKYLGALEIDNSILLRYLENLNKN
jgi:hypothetical protein